MILSCDERERMDVDVALCSPTVRLSSSDMRMYNNFIARSKGQSPDAETVFGDVPPAKVPSGRAQDMSPREQTVEGSSPHRRHSGRGPRIMKHPPPGPPPAEGSSRHVPVPPGAAPPVEVISC